MEPVRINEYSFASYLIDIRYNEQQLSKATAYIYRYEGRDYLITNKHVVKGINIITNQVLDPRGMIPNKLHLTFFVNKNDKVVSDTQDYMINLYSGDNNPNQDEKLWYEYTKDKRVDVVVIPVTIDPCKYIFDPINEVMADFNEDTKEAIADEVFVLGYPKGISVSNTPIWKKASIASEPEIDIDDLPKFFIDTATRDGMSGSPVILYKERKITRLDSIENTRKYSSHFNKLLGTYSGRILGEDEFSAQLGIVWKTKVIEDIIKESQR